jgi:creatinine amidohydrolase
MRPYLLKETNWKNVQTQKYEVAVIPWGATEAHNYHLPYGTDVIETNYIASKSAEAAWNKGSKIISLPIIPFGVNSTQLDIPLTINMNQSTQMMVLIDIISSLVNSNINKIVILNGHGGNDFKQIIRELYLKFPGTFLCQLNWFQSVNPGNYFEDTGEHAGEWETSIIMKIAPELVLPLNEAGEGKNKKLKFKASDEKWVWAPRPWTKITKDTGIGNPAKATPEKGEQYLNEVISKITGFFIELSNTKLEDLYKN